MKKRSLFIIVLIVAFLTINTLPLLASADEGDENLITELHFDKEKQILSGKTVPNANISLADVVATIVADEKGQFEVPVPKGLERTTLTFMDFINDYSTDVDYDFVAGTIATTEKEVASSSAIKENQSTTSSSKKTTQKVPERTINEQAIDEEKEPSIIIWVILLVILIVLTVLCLIAYKKWDTQKKEKQQKLEKNSKKRSRRKKRRRRSTKTDTRIDK